MKFYELWTIITLNLSRPTLLNVFMGGPVQTKVELIYFAQT